MSTSTPRTQPSRRSLLTAAATAPVLVPAVMAGSLAPALAQGAASADTPRPTVVLVHGAFADASGWSAVVRILQAAGYPVIAPADPLRGLTADADHIRSVVATIPGPVILVGHSYGGAVITNAARGAANVVGLVYIAAFIPDEGTSVATSYDPQAHPGSLLTPDALVVRPTANPVAPGGQDADLYIRPDLFRAIFAADQNRDTAAVMAATQRPLSAFAFTEPSGAPAWGHLPSWALITVADRAISPGGQRVMAARAGAEVSTVTSAHDVMVSHPEAVVRVIRKAASGAP
ncbi:MAG TPA: alpha/beta hydrolase [Ornithinibacter sp.]|nr:alpha/beta hydrolase [Ornithinibacter sp.]